jgi:hypothetical protein
MPFSNEIKIRAMVACGRRCCICHKFCGNNMEVHHIKAVADGGQDVYENAIPLCFDCHAIVRQYDPRHPKGIRFSEKELSQHRDNWYTIVAQSGGEQRTEKEVEKIKIQHENNYQNIMLHKAESGKDIIAYLLEAYGFSYDQEAETLDEVKLIGDFIQYIKEVLDFKDLIEEPSDRVMATFNLTESIKELDMAGFWVFVGKENRTITSGTRKAMSCPVFLMRIVRKDNGEIVKVKLE